MPQQQAAEVRALIINGKRLRAFHMAGMGAGCSGAPRRRRLPVRAGHRSHEASGVASPFQAAGAFLSPARPNHFSLDPNPPSAAAREQLSDSEHDAR